MRRPFSRRRIKRGFALFPVYCVDGVRVWLGRFYWVEYLGRCGRWYPESHDYSTRAAAEAAL